MALTINIELQHSVSCLVWPGRCYFQKANIRGSNEEPGFVNRETSEFRNWLLTLALAKTPGAQSITHKKVKTLRALRLCEK
jgi:hypothetical protein